MLSLDFDGEFLYEEEIGGKRLDLEKRDGKVILPLSKKRYFSATDKDSLIKAFEEGKLL